MTYDAYEQVEILDTFRAMLTLPTADGGLKRQRKSNPKPHWKIDTGHHAALYRHLERAEAGELRDVDSGASPWIHVAWRALALGYQQMEREDAAQREVAGAVTPSADLGDVRTDGGWGC